MNNITRRQVLKTSLSAIGALASTSIIGNALGATCRGKTPDQVEGPFYPIVDQLDKDVDLTRIKGKREQAKGQVIYIQGKVLDETCNPVLGAIVEIWQACASGRYNHPSDTNSAELDPHFQYWGQATTDANGNYSFKTILPGAYPASDTWMRPPHIHFKTHKLGFHELTSQLYFSQFRELNEKDRILKGLAPSERAKVTMDLKDAGPEFDAGSQICLFDIVISEVK